MFNFEFIVSCPGSYLPREKDLRASTRGLCSYSLQWHSYVYAKKAFAYTLGSRIWEYSITILTDSYVTERVRRTNINLSFSNTGTDPLVNDKATKPVFIVELSSTD